MKIVQAVPWYSDDGAGGTEVYVSTLTRLLQRAGHEVVVAVPTPGAKAHTETVENGVRVLRYATPHAPTRAQTLERVSTDGAEMLVEWCNREQPDVVHLHTLTTGLGLREIEALHARGIATVFTTHSSSLGYICQRGTLLRWGTQICDGARTPRECAACMMQKHGLGRRLSSLVAATGFLSITDAPGRIGAALQAPAVAASNRVRQLSLVSAVDAFVVLTQWAADIVIAAGAPRHKVHVNRLGIRDVPFAVASHAAERSALHLRSGKAMVGAIAPLRVGYLGRYDEIKGVTVLALAAAALPRELPIEIIFRGPWGNAEDARIAAVIRDKLGGDTRMTVGGAVPVDDTFAFLATLDVLCCPSLCAEGGPTVALEARAVGTPVIGSNIGGLSEIVMDGVDGALFAPGDDRALGALLTSLAQDRSRVAEWRSALGPVRTMANVADDYVTLYGSICKHASAS